MPDSAIIQSQPELLTLAEVAQLFRCSTRSVRRAMEAGTIRAVRLTPESAPRFPRQEIEAFIRGEARAARSHLRAYHENRARRSG